MSAAIYLEGGGDSKELHTRCREGFRKLLESCGFKGRLPRLVACGGRDSVFRDFVTAIRQTSSDSYVAMWIDSEEPMTDIELAWDHLRHVKTVAMWDKPEEARDDQVLFMTPCMETWVLCDRDTMKKHYGAKRLQRSALPPLEKLEDRHREDIQERLVRPARNCSNAYKKGKRSFEILAKLEPDTFAQHLPSFVRTRHILDEKLERSGGKEGPAKSSS